MFTDACSKLSDIKLLFLVVQVHDVQGHASTLERFPVRFRDMRQLDRIDANIINRAVLEYLKSHAKGRPTLPSIKSKDDVEKILAEGGIS